MGIKGAARHGETCIIGQQAIDAAAADGIELTVVDRKNVTTGGVASVECVVKVDLAPECFEQAAQTLKDLKAAEAAKLVSSPHAASSSTESPSQPPAETASGEAPADTVTETDQTVPTV